jgi:hypothetical protein
MPITFTINGISTTFDPTISKCKCWVQPISSILHHWRINRKCYKSLLFKEFVLEQTGFTKEPQWFGEVTPKHRTVYTLHVFKKSNKIHVRSLQYWMFYVRFLQFKTSCTSSSNRIHSYNRIQSYHFIYKFIQSYNHTTSYHLRNN